MRFADHAYRHACDRPRDPDRREVLDEKAGFEGFDNTADYIDDVQGRPDTRSFETSQGHVCWSNDTAGLMGWNNADSPEKSTVIPASHADQAFEGRKAREAKAQGVAKADFPERGPIAPRDREAPGRGAAQDASGQGPGEHEEEPRRSFPPRPPDPPAPSVSDAETQSKGHAR